MNRYENLKDIFYQTIEEKTHGIYKQRAYFHSLAVSSLCQKLALERGLNIQFIHHSSFEHAKRSSEMLASLLNEFNDSEKQIILNAIALHSHKEHIDDEYSELLKDADVLAQYLNEPDIILKTASQMRLKRLLEQG